MKIDKKVLEIIQIVLSVIGSLAIAGLVVYFVFNALLPELGLRTSPSDYYNLISSDSGGFEDAVSVDEDYAKEASDYSTSNTDSKLKKQGYVSTLVDDLDEAYDRAYEILQDYEGSLISSYESGEGNDRSISLTLKIESPDFENVYAELKDINGEVVYASYSTEDMTMEYTDLKSRLTNLEAVEDQLVEILDTAKTVSDTLDVYSELTSIRSQIEVIKGQLEYLDSQVDYSYITVTFALSESGMDIVDDTWRPLGVFRSALAALVELGKSLLNILIWILVFSPVVGFSILIIWLAGKKKVKK